MHFYYFMNLKGKKSEYNFEYKCRKQLISRYIPIYFIFHIKLMIPKILEHKPNIYFYVFF